MARLRPFVVALLCCAPALSHADRYYEPPQPAATPKDDFWREVVAPHGDEITMIIGKAQTGWNYAVQCIASDCDVTGENKAKLLDELYGMLKYARKLDPRQTDVLMWLGQVAEESGRSTAAVEAFQAYLSEVDPDTSPPADVYLRLGRAYERLGRWEDAIRAFRSAMPAVQAYGGAQAAALAYVGNALMNTGRIADAIDTLAPATSTQNYWDYNALASVMTLTVAYDRDEQINRAFETLESMQNQLTTSYMQYVVQALAMMVFVPAYDVHYFQGLFYESQGLFLEARTEWLTYAQSEGAPYRGRALDHVTAIDELRKKELEKAARAAAEAAKAAKKAAKKKKKGGGGGATQPQPYPPYPVP